jgi:hypothetical protein
MPASRAISATFRATFEPRTSKSRSSARISSFFSSRRPRRALFSRSLADTISLSAFRLVSGMLTRSITADGSRTHEPSPSRQPRGWSGGRYSSRPQLLAINGPGRGRGRLQGFYWLGSGLRPRGWCRYALDVVTEAWITCPECGFSKVETMPTNACQHFYVCASCQALLRPRHGDCCVFCSYADHDCPPKQAAA